ncbi:unnamed protein product [Lepeophtheirus salmonis]|uniref:(salmon louse) hypothetical protein n=1 Tax=Lepeophtheirus salmonis TaxID=72036 RepID=A0A7R8CWX4_LEPSM|nr:unnamed protein product [Lepeophtheirus salmonis]CAF2955543.1 unnamed protein product [Lepeophtheirus salmonis]
MSLHDRFTALRKLSVQRTSQTFQNGGNNISRNLNSNTNTSKASIPLYKPRPHQQTALQRTVAMEAALKIKKKSMKQRLGHHQQIRQKISRGNNSFRSRRPTRPFGRYPARGGANNSIYKRNVTSTFKGGARGRGSYRRLTRMPSNGNKNRYNSTRQTPNKRPNRINNFGPSPSKDELDAQLDNYMSSTKSLLDYDPIE